MLETGFSAMIAGGVSAPRLMAIAASCSACGSSGASAIRSQHALRQRRDAGLSGRPVACIDGVEHPAPVLWNDDRLLGNRGGLLRNRGGLLQSRHGLLNRRRSWRLLPDRRWTLLLRPCRKRSERVRYGLRENRRTPGQGSESEQSGLQASSSMSSNKSFHANDLFEG